MIDYAADLYDPIFATLGVPAVLTMPDTTGEALDLIVIDKTAGTNVGTVEMPTVLPAAAVRAIDLAGIDLEDVENATLALNGRTWRVKSYRLAPSPKGEADGQVYLVLSEQ